ncbi:MAG: CPBP family intramembrane glutamic endopeptidase [Trueperaceae bacterium]
MTGEPGSRNFLAGIAADLARLFPPRGGVSALLTIALLLQVAYWYFGAPGSATPRDPEHALRSVLWAVLLLGLVPLLLIRPLGLRGEELGVSKGDVAAGRQALLFGLAAVIPIAWFAAGNSSFQLTYPWPGHWVGGNAIAFLSWAFTYSLYYLAYEFFYRGFLLRGLEQSLGVTAALWLQTVASTMLHLGKPLLETIAAVPAGLIFGLVALRTRSLLYVVVIHLALGIATDLFVLLRSGGVG